MTASASLRVTARRTHLWLGLTIGALFALVGLTGSALVFYLEIDAFALRAVPEGTRPVSWQAVVDTLHRAHPTHSGAWRIEVTPGGGAIPARHYSREETGGRHFAPRLVWIDPVRLTTVRSGIWGKTVVTWIYDLHYRLLLGKPGGVALGVAGIVMLALLASGLWAWWPRTRGWRRALRFKRGAVPTRRLYDWHKTFGLSGLVVLLVVTATGVLLDLPDQVRPIVARFSPLYATPLPTLAPGATRLPIDALVARAQRRFPDATLAWIEVPSDATAPVRINLARPGEPSRRFPRTNVWLDPYDGRVVGSRDGLAESGGDTLLDWLHPLHGGEAFGLVGRLLAFAAGLVPAILFATGMLRWRQRRMRRH